MIDWQAVLTVFSMLSAMLFAFLGWRRNTSKDATDMGANLATLQASVSMSNARLDEVLRRLEAMQQDDMDIMARVSKLESDAEGMRRQHDELEGRVMRLEKQTSQWMTAAIAPRGPEQ